MDKQDVKKRIRAAYTLLLEESTTREKFESIRTLIKGINSKVDSALENTSQALSDYEKLQKGEVIELAAEHLPENTEEEKRRKKTLLLFIKNWKELRSEVERVRGEFENDEERQRDTETKYKSTESWARIVTGAKGPMGIITLAAIVIVAGFMFLSQNKPSSDETSPVTVQQVKKNTIQVIEFQSKQIPLSELEVRSGPDCESKHYHAIDGISVTTLEGEIMNDPGGCAFGREGEVSIIEVALQP